MGLLSRRSNEIDRANGTNTTTTTHGTHHPVRDGAIAGASAHHEGKNHPDRDAVLAGGAVGEFQHHRNEKELRAARNADPFSTNTTVTGKHHLGRDPVAVDTIGDSDRYGDSGSGVSRTGATLGSGPAGANTGPAPLSGVSGSAARPTIAEASKLERKGKLEHTMGGLLCSQSLKAKSATHLAQADHIRMQANELTEAEALEHQAGLRRQRAVGLGADPVHASGQTGFGSNHVNKTASVV